MAIKRWFYLLTVVVNLVPEIATTVGFQWNPYKAKADKVF